MNKILFICLSLYSLLATAQTTTELIVKNKIDHITAVAREPMLCEHPNGTLFVSGYDNPSDSPQLWKSSDLGKTWQRVNVGTKQDGAIGNSDVDLFIDTKGNIYLVSMTFTKLPEDLKNFDFSTLKGERITVGVSRDEGETWNWQTISENPYDDRPWIDATSDGALHIIWNDGKGIHHAESADDGKTWQNMPDISTKGGSSYLASGFNGQLAVRVAPLSASAYKMDKDVDLIRLSLDNGATWSSITIPGKRTWTQDLSGIPRWVEPMAWDKEGKLYTLWSEGLELKLGVTNDDGRSWKEYIVLKSSDTLYFPYMKMSDEGILCTWVSGFKDDIKHHAAVIRLEDDKVQTYQLEPQKLDIWSRFPTKNYQRSTGGEYFPIIPLSNGNIGMVTTLQNIRAKRDGFTWWELELNSF